MEKQILEDISWAKRKNSGVLLIDDEEKIEFIDKVLEKQLSKKPVKHTIVKDKLTYLCPTCNRLYWKWDFLSNYCDSCGQKFNLD